MRKSPIRFKLKFTYLYICLVTLVVAVLSFLNLKLIPIDGLLQTFNSTRRMILGQIPYQDFLPYLGLGPTYINFFGASLLGGTLVSQFIFINVLHLIIGFFIIYTCFEIFTTKEIKDKFWPPTVIVISVIYLVGLHFPFKSLFFILAEYTRPGNSALGLRAVILFLTIFICVKIEKGPLVFLGFLIIGISTIWSVDYALPTYIIGSLLFRLQNRPTLSSLLKNTLLNLLVGAAIGNLLVSVLTNNNFNLFISSNYLTQRDFQYWYFGIDENFVYGIGTVPYLLAFVVSTLIGVLYLLRDFNKSNITKCLAILGTNSIGIVSQLNSAPSPRYLVFALLVNIFAFFDLWFCSKREGLEFKYFRFKVVFELNSKIRDKITLFRFLESYLEGKIKLLLILLLSLVLGVNIILANNYISKNVYVKKIGGYIDPRLMDSVRFGESISKIQNANLISTYTGVASLVSSKLNPTKTDYIIHAFTPNERQNWIDALKDPKTKYVITTRLDVLKWESWITKANWWFYSELLREFEVSSVGVYEVYWSRKSDKKTDYLNIDKFTCDVNAIDSSKSYVSIIPVDVRAMKSDIELLFSIELDYESQNLGDSLTSRNRVTITAINETFNLNPEKPNSFLNVGAPWKADSYQTYLKYVNFSSNQLLVKTSPELNSVLKIKECRISAAYDYKALFPELPETKVSFDEIVRDFRR